ncbi:MAG: epoxyqueuosine reductase, partial [Candidatus Hodarchaeota archaeon]
MKEKILDWGASLVGFANLKGIIPQRWGDLKSGISIAVRLSTAIIAEIETEPTSIYAHHYYVSNLVLDTIAFKTANHLQSKGYKSLPVPASQKYDPVELKGDISHKMVATCAGMGWIGKNALLVTPQYGPRVRLVSVLTDAPLDP